MIISRTFARELENPSFFEEEEGLFIYREEAL